MPAPARNLTHSICCFIAHIFLLMLLYQVLESAMGEATTLSTPQDQVQILNFTRSIWMAGSTSALWWLLDKWYAVLVNNFPVTMN